MSQKTKAKIFIQTLEEMRNHDRECQKARLRLKIKAQVDRFMKDVPSAPDGSRSRAARAAQAAQPLPASRREILNEGL